MHTHIIRILQKECEKVNWKHLCFSLTPSGTSWKTVFSKNSKKYLNFKIQETIDGYKKNIFYLFIFFEK